MMMRRNTESTHKVMKRRVNRWGRGYMRGRWGIWGWWWLMIGGKASVRLESWLLRRIRVRMRLRLRLMLVLVIISDKGTDLKVMWHRT